jgi:DNA polymerase-3 subunit gamma/tau
MARSLNCEKGPTPNPCGECQSCKDLVANGPGSIDVIELDAATHGLVDDARDLREKAFFSPVASRYKIYIIDEAHQLGPGAANALLKVVEEPPPHVVFIFATTEPDKLISTIRSRTHHYPFRLVPPGILNAHLEKIAALEKVKVAKGVLPLVVRASGGSVRDSLSILGQLIAGAGKDGVTYEIAIQLLGYTDSALMDQAIDALAARDGSTLLKTIDSVIESGSDPRRFAGDLLDRLRDLIVVASVDGDPTSILRGYADDQVSQLQRQAQHMGVATLVRDAEIVAQGLTEMRGATSPRLSLESMCGKLLLPAADSQAVLARIERLEKGASVFSHAAVPTEPMAPNNLIAENNAGNAASGAALAKAALEKAAQKNLDQAATVSTAQSDNSTSLGNAQSPTSHSSTGVQSPSADNSSETSAGSPSAPAKNSGNVSTPNVDAVAASWDSPTPSLAQKPTADKPAAKRTATRDANSIDIAGLRRLWPEVVENVKERRRLTWSLISSSAQIISMDDVAITIGIVNVGARDSFIRSGSDEILRAAFLDVTGIDKKVECIIDSAVRPAAHQRTTEDPSDEERPSGHALLMKELGAQIIEERPNK